MSKLQRIVVIGPTASGKSALAAHLANRLGSIVISADARQCYRELNIGTAKPEPELLAMAPHRYIDILNPDEPENASAFRRRCDVWEQEHFRQSAAPVVYAGGSTLYLQSLLFDLDDVPSANAENLATLKERAEREGLGKLYEELAAIDPVYVARIDGMNRHRMFRALDVWMQTGRPFSSFHKQDGYDDPRARSLVVMPDIPRAELHARINQRVDLMIKAGLVEEVRDLLTRWDENLQSLQTVGYREVISHLKGDISYEQMKADIKTNTRRYAKRQLTWFRRWPFVQKLPATFHDQLQAVTACLETSH
ncbi:tRNA dimethylallyltransferase [Cyclonatronum proteinivorum]|uniref:tRNA dimethylallyltransferase n=2 Tax=Cyclonatronum proteinivorum TaxID=1457365 RepID=A0A345UI84_9BACT|nr:tRNA dimethylallyltransferase [Cyclonatronum proteinivorum]